jgi:hypothetical protein
MISRLPRYFWWLAASLAFGWLMLPVLAYVLGRQVIGPYEGSRGLASYVGSIYSAVGQGQPLAIAMVFAPALLLGIWALQAYLRRTTAGTDGAEAKRTMHGK